ncbi:hypothetical protein F2981_07130 [Sinorhizobium meliloti]|nr:hypothetical protein [Sinorhizobium meliloti]
MKFIFADDRNPQGSDYRLSRCQRFDLRRISASIWSASSPPFSARREWPSIRGAGDGGAGSGRARRATACRCSIRRSPMAAVRSRSKPCVRCWTCRPGADRRPVRACHQGRRRRCAWEFAAQYEAGANPTVVLTDLADFTTS